jgi:hypothetical protein
MINIPADEIDNLIKEQYLDLQETGELQQLSKLFGSSFLDGLVKLIYPTLTNRRNYQEKLEISLCWIDKSPLADFTKNNVKDHNGNLVTQKVEVADAAFMFFTEDAHPTNETTSLSSCKSLLFQAKRSRSLKSLPRVPITQNNSSAKELVLLSQWPEFDLYKTSRNHSPLQTNLRLQTNQKDLLSLGWFGACPPSKEEAWKSRWMCAPAELGASCEHTLGEVISALLRSSKLHNLSVGQSFNYQQGWVSGLTQCANAWDTLNNEILAQCKESTLPKSIFKSEKKRVQSSTPFSLFYNDLPIAIAPTKHKVFMSSSSSEYCQHVELDNLMNNDKSISLPIGEIMGRSAPAHNLLKTKAFPVIAISLIRSEHNE